MAVVNHEWLAMNRTRILCQYTLSFVSKSKLCFHFVFSIKRSVCVTMHRSMFRESKLRIEMEWNTIDCLPVKTLPSVATNHFMIRWLLSFGLDIHIECLRTLPTRQLKTYRQHGVIEQKIEFKKSGLRVTLLKLYS